MLGTIWRELPDPGDSDYRLRRLSCTSNRQSKGLPHRYYADSEG